MSWWIEAPIAAWILDDLPTRFVDAAVRDANLVTYWLLATLLCLLLAFSLRDTHATVYGNRDREAEPEEDAASIDPWTVANDHAKRGMASLRVAETWIDRKRRIHAVPDVRKSYDTSDEKAA
jgi:hypothetical protein